MNAKPFLNLDDEFRVLLAEFASAKAESSGPALAEYHLVKTAHWPRPRMILISFF